MPQATVIICAHNPRPHYLSRVLEALRTQTLPLAQWELLLIDNASQTPLNAGSWDLSWHHQARHIREDQLGLARARQRGMREAGADILVFVDDDNVLAPDYLDEALRIGREWPMLGVWGSGATFPEFEVRPPDALSAYLDRLPIRYNKMVQFSNTMPCYPAMPWGAGQCLRAEVAIAYLRQFESSSIKIADRTGGSLDSAGDTEICYVATASGMGIGIFPELKLTHLMPKERLREDYLVRLADGVLTSNLLTEYKWAKAIPPSRFAGALGMARVIRNTLALRGIGRRIYLAELRAWGRTRGVILELERSSAAARTP